MANHEHVDAAAAPATSGSTTTGLGSDPRIDSCIDPCTMGERQCGWCTNHFPVLRRPGRPLIYCSRSCRQRAYERRKGLSVLPPPDRIIMQPGGPLGHLRPRAAAYELGRITWATGKFHAMRPSGVADTTGRRLTLCGLLARSSPRPYHPSMDGSCRTCARVRDVRPPVRAARPSDDLAALRSLLDAAAVELSRSPRSHHRPKGPGEILTDLLMAV
jgi:hypothetical protein